MCIIRAGYDKTTGAETTIMDAVTEDLSAKIQLWRQKAKDNTLTPEEMREAIKALRAGRLAAAGSASGGKKAHVAKAPVDGDALLSELESI